MSATRPPLSHHLSKALANRRKGINAHHTMLQHRLRQRQAEQLAEAAAGNTPAPRPGPP